MRSRAVSLPFSCCLAIRAWPPPASAACLAVTMRSHFFCAMKGRGGQVQPNIEVPSTKRTAYHHHRNSRCPECTQGVPRTPPSLRSSVPRPVTGLDASSSLGCRLRMYHLTIYLIRNVP